MKTFLHNMELRKFFPILTAIVLLLLAAITLLGTKQYLLYRHCNTILNSSNKINFQFTSIKEHINDSLLSGTPLNIPQISQELLGFDEELKNILDDILIPEEFKISFISQVDLMGLVVQLRTIKNNLSSRQQIQLASSLRSISNRLTTFHNSLTTYTRALLLGLYKVIVGTLALIIFCTTSMLLLINRFIAVPIVKLCTITEERAKPDQKKFLKTRTLPNSIQSLTSFVTQQQAYARHIEHLHTCLNNVLQTVPDAFTSPDDWETLCSALQTNPDYFLVWVGQHATGTDFPAPVTGCGCVSSSPSQCRQTIEHLIEFCHQEGGLCETARRTMEQGIHHTAITTSEELGNSLRNTLGIRNQPVFCASFPIADATGTFDTVITLYSTSEESFSDLEISVLIFLCRHIGSIRRQQAVPPAATGTDSAELYRFSVAGELAGSLAHEMINLANGSLNYSQALVDLTIEKEQHGDEYLLLEKLHTEEKKISRLAADFNRLTNTSVSGREQISLHQIVESLSHLMRGRFRQQNITVQTTIDVNQKDIQVTIPVALLQTVLLTLLHEAEQHIATLPSTGNTNVFLKVKHRPGENEICITVSPLPVEIETRMEILEEQSPWPSPGTCSAMIEQCRGRLEFSENTDGSSVTAVVLLPA